MTEPNPNSSDWHGEKWWQQQLETANAYIGSGLKGDDKLCRHFAEKIIMDQNLDDGSVKDRTSDVYQAIIDSKQFQVKGPRSPLCRWFGWLEVADWWDCEWHIRLLILTMIGAQQGWFHQAGPEATLRKVKTADPNRHQTMQQSKASISHLRDQSKNHMHLACTVLFDTIHLARTRMMIAIAMGLRLEQGLLAKRLRSPDKCREYYINMAVGGKNVMEPIFKCTEPFYNFDELARIGFMVSVFSPKSRALDTTSAHFLHELELGTAMSRLAFSLMMQRLRSLLPLVHAYPWAFSRLLSERPSEVKAGLTQMKKDWLAWQEIQTSTLSFWKKICKRSCMAWPVVRLMFHLASEVNFEKVTGGMTCLCEAFSSQFGQTKVVEDAIKDARDRERMNPSKRQSNLQIWRGPILEQVMCSTHKFTEVSADDVEPAVKSKTDLPKNVFTPSFKSTSTSLRSLPGKSGVTSWTTFSPDNFPELLAMRWFVESKSVRLASEAWRTCLMNTGTLVRKRDGTTPRDWCWVMGQCTTMEVSFHKLWVIPVLNFVGWEAWPVQWAGLLGVALATSELRPEDPWPRGMAVSVGKPRPLVEVAARHAFWNLHEGALDKFIAEEHYEIPIAPNESFPAKLLKAIMAVLGCEKQEALQILELRSLSFEEG